MYQHHESIANLSPERVAAILSNCVSFFNPDEDTQAEPDSSLTISKLESDRSTILFNSALVAREAAYVLRGEWDGVNAVIVAQPDFAATKTAVELLKLELGQEIEFCHNGERCPLPELLQTPIHLHLLDRPRSGKSILLSGYLIQALA